MNEDQVTNCNDPEFAVQRDGKRNLVPKIDWIKVVGVRARGTGAGEGHRIVKDSSERDGLVSYSKWK